LYLQNNMFKNKFQNKYRVKYECILVWFVILVLLLFVSSVYMFCYLYVSFCLDLLSFARFFVVICLRTIIYLQLHFEMKKGIILTCC
jgi:hypothetical protein